MSVVIRNQLDVILNRLLTEIATAKTLSSAETPQITELAASGERLSRGMRFAQGFLDQWARLIINLTAENLNNEEKVFIEYKVKDKSPAQIIDEAFQAQTDVDIKIDKLRAGEKGEHPHHPVRDFAPNIRLPTLDLPTFDGQEANWPTFWAAFESAIHDNDSITAPQKFTYLMGRLKGSAKGLVEGYAVTEANYHNVIKLLLERFGDDERRSSQLQSELIHLQRPSNSPHSLRIFHDHVERICRQLEGMGVDINKSPFLTIAIKEKLPNEAKGHLFDKEMGSGKKWSRKEWRAGGLWALCPAKGGYWAVH